MNFFKKSLFKKENLILLFILIIGSILRLEGVINNSFAFTYDVGRDMLSLWNIAYNHKLSLIGPTTGIPGVFYGPWWYLILLPFFVVFKGSPQGIAFTMSLFGIVSIFLSFYLGKKIANSFLGISMALLTAISPIMVSLSSQIWNPNIAPLLVLLIFLILRNIYLLKNKAKPYYFFLLGFLLVLNIDIEILWGILFFIGVVLSMLIILKRKITNKQILLFLSGGVLILLPRIIFELRHSFLMSKSFFSFFGKKTMEDKLDLYHFLENRVFTYFDQFANTFLPNKGYIELFLLIFIVVVILLFYKKANNIIKDFILTSIIIFLVFFLGTLIFSHALWPHYFVGLPIIYILLLSISLYLLFKNSKKYIISILILIILFLFNFTSFSFVKNFQKPLWEGDASVFRNQLAVVDYIYSDVKEKDFKYELYTPPVFDNTYQYLFKWYGSKKYGYVPSKKAGIMYFIIEPDEGYPDRPKWWLEAREKDGKIIDIKTLKGKIVVQKRLVD